MGECEKRLKALKPRLAPALHDLASGAEMSRVAKALVRVFGASNAAATEGAEGAAAAAAAPAPAAP